MTPHDWKLIALALTAVGALVILITRLKVNPFIALLLAALIVGGGATLIQVEADPVKRVSLLTSAKSFQDGMGATLGGIAAVIGLGMMLGKLLAESGGAEVLAKRFAAFFGPRRVVWCIMALALVVGLTTWFTVGLILLLPIMLNLVRETKQPFVLLALPLLSCLSVMHGLMPPHPGPVVAVDQLKANTGLVLFWGFVIGIPLAIIAGPLFARWAVKHVDLETPEIPARALGEKLILPGFGLTLFSIVLPVALMLIGTLAELLLQKGHPLRVAATFIGNPTIALLIAVLFAGWSLGTRVGYGRMQILKFTEECIATVGMTLLVVGGGGGFARVLRDAGVADAMGAMAQAAHLPPLVYGWMVAAFIRVATGSATVAITAASGLLGPILALHPDTNIELMVICLGCGSLFLSHLNDGGFWIVKDLFGWTVGQTLRTWTVCETIIGLAGLGLTLLVSLFV